LNGDGTERMQELALNALVTLSLSGEAEHAILNQGTVKPVVGLLTSSNEQLKEQAAMLLSNLLTNEKIRENIRYLSWCEPMTAILQSGSTNAVCQVTRCIVNITFDEHCRYMCVKAGIAAKLKNAASRVRDGSVTELSNTACSNLEVGVSGHVEREVDDALKSGKVTKVAAPTSQQKTVQVNKDFDGLDELLGGSSKPSSTPSKPAPKQVSNAALDDLDSLLDGPSKPSQKPTPQASKPAPKKS